MNKDYLLPRLPLNKKTTSGGKNSTAKTVPITYGMTTDEINKRKTYNAQVESGLTTKSYAEFSKNYAKQQPLSAPKTVKTPVYTMTAFTPEAVRNNLLQGTGSVTDLIRAKKISTPEEIRKQIVSSTGATVFDLVRAKKEEHKAKKIQEAQNKVYEAEEAFKPYAHITDPTMLSEKDYKEYTRLKGNIDKAKLGVSYTLEALEGKTKTLEATHPRANEVVQVETLTKDNLEEYTLAQELGVLQPVFLTDEDYVWTSKTAYGVQEISKSYLTGIKETDGQLWYDAVSGKLYRIESDTKDSAEIRKNMEDTAKNMQIVWDGLQADMYKDLHEASKLATQIAPYVKRIEAGTATRNDYDTVNTLIKQYNTLTETDTFKELTEKYNTEIQKLNEYQKTYQQYEAQYNLIFKNGEIVMSGDYAAQMQKNVDEVSAARKQYIDYYAGSEDTSSTNSIKDIVFNLSSDITAWISGFGEAAKQTWESGDIGYLGYHTIVTPLDIILTDIGFGALDILNNQFVKPIDYMLTEPDADWGTAGSIALNQFLTFIAETGDVFAPLKSSAIAERTWGNEEVILQDPTLKKAYTDAVRSADGDMDKAYGLYKDNLWNAYWGVGAANPVSLDFTMAYKEGEMDALDYVSSFGLEMLYDLSTLFSLGGKLAVKAGVKHAIDDVADLSADLLKATDFSGDLTDAQLTNAAKKAIKSSIKDGLDLSETLPKQLTKAIMKADDTVKVRNIVDLLPTSTTQVARKQTQKAILEVLSSASDATRVASRLGDAYEVVDSMTNVYRAMNYIDTMAFKMMFSTSVMPPVYLARFLKGALKNSDTVTKASTFLGRFDGLLKKLMKADGTIDNVDQVLDKMAKEAKVLGDEMYDDVNSAVHRAVRNYDINNQINNIRHVMSDDALFKASNAEEVLSNVNRLIKKMVPEEHAIESMSDYIRYLKRPLGEAKHTIYEMLTPEVISKLRALSSDYNMLRRIAVLQKVNAITKQADEWSNTVSGLLRKAYDSAYDTTALAVELREASLNLIENSKKLYVDGLTTTTKDELMHALMNVEHELNTVFHAIDAGEPIVETAFNEALTHAQGVFDKYSQGLRDYYARVYLNSMDTRVERMVFDGVYEQDISLCQEVIKGFTAALNGKYGIEATERMVAEAFVHGIEELANGAKNLDMDDYTRIYTTIMEKSSNAVQYLGDEQLVECADLLLSNTSAVTGVVDMLKFSKVADGKEIAPIVMQLNKLRQEALAFSTTRNLYNFVLNADMDAAFKKGIIDALSGEAGFINEHIWSSVDVFRANSVENTADAITNRLFDKACEYLSNKSTDDVKLFGTRINGTYRKMCTLDTEHNVHTMLECLEDIPGAAKYLDDDADKYLDVYFSVSRTSDYSNPYMVTFHHNGETVTLKNKDTMFRPTQEYLLHNHGMKLNDATRAEFDALNITEGLTRTEFDDAITDTLMKYKQMASKDNKSIRFIGYNNGKMGTRQDGTLSTFIQKAAVPVHNDLTVDLADFIRADRGVPVYSTSTHATLKDGVRHYVHVSLSQGGGEQFITAMNKDLFANASVLSINMSTMRGKFNMFTDDYFESAINTVANLSNAVTNVQKRTDAMLGNMQDVLINEKAVLDIVNQLMPSRHITGINVHALLEEAMRYTGKDFILNTQKLVDTAAYEYLFDMQWLSKVTSTEDLLTVKKMSRELLNSVGKIRQPEVLDVVGVDAYKEAFLELVGELKISEAKNHTDIRILLDAINLDTANTYVMFSACKYLTDHSSVSARTAMDVLKYSDNYDEAVMNALLTVHGADDIIFNTATKVFTPTHRTTLSKLYGDANRHVHMIDDMRQFDEYAKTVDDLNLYIAGREAILEQNNYITATDQMCDTLFRQIAEPYTTYVQGINYDIGFLTQGAHEPLNRLQNVARISARADKYKSMIGLMGTVHRNTAVRTVFGLSDENFSTYVIKNCKNNLIIDLNSSFMKDEKIQRVVMEKIKHLKTLDGVVVDDMGSDFVKIFYDLDRIAHVDVDEFYRNIIDRHVDYATTYKTLRKEVFADTLKTFVKKNPSINSNKKLKKLFKWYYFQFERFCGVEDALAKNMPNHWIVSTFNVNTQETAKHIQQFFPDNANMNVALMKQYGMFDEAFTCSVWADGAVIRNHELIKYHSDDVVKSMGNGLYQVRNNLEAVKNKFALYNNSHMSLTNIVKNTGIAIEDYEQLNRILDMNGYVLHKGWQDEFGKMHIEKITITSNAQLGEILKDTSVIVSPYNDYSEMVQFIKGNNHAIRVQDLDSRSEAVYDMMVYSFNQLRAARNTGYLSTKPSTVLRNKIAAWLNAVSATDWDIATYRKYERMAPELLSRYDEVLAKVTREYHYSEFEDIVRFFAEHADETEGLSLDLMRTVYAYKKSAASGSMLAETIQLNATANFKKLQALVADNPNITDDMLETAVKVYQKEANKAVVHPGKDFAKHRNSVYTALKAKGFTGEVLEELSDLYFSYEAGATGINNWLRNSPSVFARLGAVLSPSIHTLDKLSLSKSAKSNWVTLWANEFSKVEERTRLAMVLYFTEELGYSMSKATHEVVKAQFDYNTRPSWLEALEIFFPFSTYKIYNLQYWLKEAPKHFNTMQLMSKSIYLTEPYYDSDEIMNLTRGLLLRRKIASGEIVLEDDGTVDEEHSDDFWAAFAQTIMGEDGAIETYEGQLRMYAQLAGSIPLGKHHVLKVGNTFIEASTFMNTLATAIPQILSGKVPDVVADSVVSPVGTVFNFLQHYRNSEGFSEQMLLDWWENNWYDTIDMLPFYGTLVNNAITHMKNARLNMKDIWVIITNPQLKDEFLNTIFEQAMCFAGAVIPSIVGTVRDNSYFDRPIGYDWYNQSEEYKKTHRFVFGVSYMPTWYAKNPAEYVNYVAKYMELGYTREEALEILAALYGQENTKAPVQWAFNQDMFDEALAMLLDSENPKQGKNYTMAEALEILMNEDLWNTDELALKLGAIKKEQALQNSAFYKLYGMLPDYIKYTDQQFSDLRKYYREQGYNEAQQWIMMLQGSGFISPDGSYKALTPEQVAKMNEAINDTYYEYMAGLPTWYKYEEGAATRTVNYLKEKFGMNTEQAREYIIKNNFYVDANGKPIYYTAEESTRRTEQNQKDFYEYYETLPDFIKYEKGAYGRTLKYLKELGLGEETAKKMIQNGAYLTLAGELIDCTGLVRSRQYNKLMSNSYKTKYTKYVTRPKRVKKRYIKQARARRPYKVRGNNSMTYSLVNVRNGSNFGTRNAYKVTLGYNSASAILSTRGNYPQTWRNVAQSYRRNLYKEHYAKYGMSRMQMRSGGWKGYSNASVTRLRRENVYASRRYRNRRVF